MRINRGDMEGAAEQFMTWVKGGGRILPGLVKRRIAEKNLFLGTLYKG
jgi:lysozyme